MTKTKQRVAEQQNEGTQLPPQGTAIADDKTAIDEVETKKRKKGKEKLPKGYKKRLPGGVEREIRVNKEQLHKVDGKPMIVVEETEDGFIVKSYDKVKIEGECELVHDVDKVCGKTRGKTQGSVCIRTKGSILVGKSRK